MRRVCFLSTDDLYGYTFDDDLAVGPLRDLGWQAETISWHDANVDWNDYEAIVLRTTWDYQHHADEFVGVLEKIDASNARLENPLDIVRWNLSKTYLRETEERGCPIVPTVWDDPYTESAFESRLTGLQTDELIVKPTISADRPEHFQATEIRSQPRRNFLVPRIHGTAVHARNSHRGRIFVILFWRRVQPRDKQAAEVK